MESLKGYTWTSNNNHHKGWLLQTTRYRPNESGNVYMDVRILKWGKGKFPAVLDPRLPKTEYSFHILSKRYLSKTKVRVYGYSGHIDKLSVLGDMHINKTRKQTKAMVRQLGQAMTDGQFYGNNIIANNAVDIMTTSRQSMPKGF